MPVRIGSVSENPDNILKGGQAAKNVPGPGRARMGSTLTARDANARAGSRSSVSSQDGEKFYTANKVQETKPLPEKFMKSKVFRPSQKWLKENPQVLVSCEATDLSSVDASPSLRKVPEVVLNPAELVSADATFVVKKEDPSIEGSKDVADTEILPPGVLNIRD